MMSFNQNVEQIQPSASLPVMDRARQPREENGIPCAPEDVLVTPGGKFAIYLALTSMLNPGDEALILDPSWVSCAPIVQACGGTPVGTGLSFEDSYRITREKLERAAGPRAKVLVVNSPNNPSGRVLTREEAETLAAFARERDLLMCFMARCRPSTA